MRETNYKKYLYICFLILYTIACNAIGFSSHTRESNKPLISREQYKWIPPYDEFTTFGSLPFDSYIEDSNQTIAESRDNPEEMLKFLNKVGRINSYGYAWGTNNCWLTNDVFEISGGSITVIWFKTAEGAQEAFKYYENEDRNDSDYSVESFNYGEGAHINSWNSSDDCSDNVRNRELVWIRYNVIATVNMSSHGKLSDDGLNNYIVEVANQLDDAINKEATTFPAANIQENETSDAPNINKSPSEYLEGELTCNLAGGRFSVSGSLMNNSDRPISLLIILNVTGSGTYFSSTDETVSLPAKEKTDIFFSAYESVPDPYLLAPPDDPDTPEYEPEQWLELPGNSPEYSCEINSTPTWGN